MRIHVNIVRGLCRLAVDALDDDPFCALVSEQQSLVQLAGYVVDALVVSEDTLRDGLTDLSDKTLHIEVFKDTTDNGMCE